MRNLKAFARLARRMATSLLFAALLAAAGSPAFFVAAAPLAATSPTLVASAGYSVLAAKTVTCTGATTINGSVGVSPGTSITGFPSPCAAGGGTHSNDTSAIAAQADNLTAFGALDQTCDQTFGAVDLTVQFPSGVGPGVYCSTSSFSLSGNLNLTGSGVWIFKTVSTLITSSGSSITGGDPCNVWWRVGSSATLATNTAFIGSILALTDITVNTGATVNGRAMVQTGQVTLDTNTFSGPVCAAAATATPTVTATATATVTPTGTSTATATVTSAGTSTATATVTPTGTSTATATISQSGTPPSTSTVTPTVTPTAHSAPHSQNTPVPAPTQTPLLAPTVTVPAVVGLPATGGGPLPGTEFPWSQTLAAGALGAVALALGFGAYRRRRTDRTAR